MTEVAAQDRTSTLHRPGGLHDRGYCFVSCLHEHQVSDRARAIAEVARQGII